MYVYSGKDGSLLYSVDPPSSANDFGWWMVSGIGDANGDRKPDIYLGDFNDAVAPGRPRGRASVISGENGLELHSWVGEPQAGLGPGRTALDVDGDGAVDLAVGSYTSDAGGQLAGMIQIFSGRTGLELRRVTSTTPGEALGFDAIGLSDVDRDGIPELLGSAAEGDSVYLFRGRRP